MHSSFSLRHLWGCLGKRILCPIHILRKDLYMCWALALFPNTAFPLSSQLGHESVDNQAGGRLVFHANDSATLCWRVPRLQVPVPLACSHSLSSETTFSFLHTAVTFLFLAWCCVWPHRPCRLFLLTAATSPYGSHYHKLLPSLKPVCKWVDCRQQGGQVHMATRQAPRIGLDRYVGLDECPLKPN